MKTKFSLLFFLFVFLGILSGQEDDKWKLLDTVPGTKVKIDIREPSNVPPEARWNFCLVSNQGDFWDSRQTNIQEWKNELHQNYIDHNDGYHLNKSIYNYLYLANSYDDDKPPRLAPLSSGSTPLIDKAPFVSTEVYIGTNQHVVPGDDLLLKVYIPNSYDSLKIHNVLGKKYSGENENLSDYFNIEAIFCDTYNSSQETFNFPSRGIKEQTLGESIVIKLNSSLDLLDKINSIKNIKFKIEIDGVFYGANTKLLACHDPNNLVLNSVCSTGKSLKFNYTLNFQNKAEKKGQNFKDVKRSIIAKLNLPKFMVNSKIKLLGFSPNVCHNNVSLVKDNLKLTYTQTNCEENNGNPLLKIEQLNGNEPESHGYVNFEVIIKQTEPLIFRNDKIYYLGNRANASILPGHVEFDNPGNKEEINVFIDRTICSNKRIIRKCRKYKKQNIFYRILKKKAKFKLNINCNKNDSKHKTYPKY